MLALALVLQLAAGPAQPMLGQQAPGFRLDDLQGRPVALEDYRGKLIVLHFGASW